MVMMMTMMVIMMMVCKKRVKRWIGSHGRTTNELLNAHVVTNKPLLYSAPRTLIIQCSKPLQPCYTEQFSAHFSLLVNTYCSTTLSEGQCNILHCSVNLLYNIYDTHKCMIQLNTAQRGI